ncbi:uncharacterized protein LOC9644671 [Selaginella moellendorffii]|nr:uncharacterized protein LOC9644671 [Selaginella moellendorffii]|eukprot:XP_024544808.1 uncharacterized protein LOC9644671 [Selaginella moellendorffii]
MRRAAGYGLRAPVIHASRTVILSRCCSGSSEGDLACLFDALDARRGQCEEAVADWMSRGNALTPDSVGSIFDHLTGRNRYKEALKVLKLVRENNVVELSVKNCIKELTLLCRQHAPIPAEVIFLSLPESMKTEELIAAFVISLAKQKSWSRAEVYKQQLTTISPEVEDAMISLYFSKDFHDRALASYQRLRYSGIKPMLHTYLTLLKCKERIGGLGGLEREALAAAKSVDLSTANERDLANLMEIHGYLHDPDSVGAIWSIVKQRSPRLLHDSYAAAIKAFGLVGEVEKAEVVLEETIASKSVRYGINPYHGIIEVYARVGLLDRAEETLRRKTDNSVFQPFNSLILGYLARNDIARALQLLEEGWEKRQIDSSLGYLTTIKLLRVFAARRDVGSAEKLIAMYRNRGDSTLCNAIVNVYAAAQQPPNFQLLRTLKINPP